MSTTVTPTKLISVLLHSITQVHIYHIVTYGHPYHKILKDFYEKMSDLTDIFSETFQKLSKSFLKNIQNYKFDTDTKNILKYFKKFLKTLKNSGKVFDKYPQLLEIFSEIYELTTTTMYRLIRIKGTFNVSLNNGARKSNRRGRLPIY